MQAPFWCKWLQSLGDSKLKQMPTWYSISDNETCGFNRFGQITVDMFESWMDSFIVAGCQMLKFNLQCSINDISYINLSKNWNKINFPTTASAIHFALYGLRTRYSFIKNGIGFDILLFAKNIFQHDLVFITWQQEGSIHYKSKFPRTPKITKLTSNTDVQEYPRFAL